MLLTIYRLEECIREIVQMSNDLTEGDKQCRHPVDAINKVIEDRLLEKTTCYDLDPAPITKLLTHLVSDNCIYLLSFYIPINIVLFVFKTPCITCKQQLFGCCYFINACTWHM